MQQSFRLALIFSCHGLCNMTPQIQMFIILSASLFVVSHLGNLLLSITLSVHMSVFQSHGIGLSVEAFGLSKVNCGLR